MNFQNILFALVFATTFHMTMCSALNRFLHFPDNDDEMFPGDDDAMLPGDSPGEESGPGDEGGPGAWYDYLQEDMEKSKGKEEVAETSTTKIRAEGNQSFA